MEIISALLALCEGNPPVPGGFPSQRIVTRSFDVFFNLRLNKRLSKQSRPIRFETPSCSLWRHCNDCDAKNTDAYVRHLASMSFPEHHRNETSVCFCQKKQFPNLLSVILWKTRVHSKTIWLKHQPIVAKDNTDRGYLPQSINNSELWYKIVLKCVCGFVCMGVRVSVELSVWVCMVALSSA